MIYPCLLAVLGGVFRHSHCVVAHEFHQNRIRADFHNPIPRDKYCFRARNAFQKALFAGHDDSAYVSAIRKNNVARLAEFLAVGNVYHGFS